MDQVIQAVHDPIRRAKWDKNIDQVRIIRNINRVQILHTIHTPHFLESVVRDMFEKKFGFTHRPPVTSRFDDQMSNGKSMNQDETLRSLEIDDSTNLHDSKQLQNIQGRNSYKFQSDQIEYYMFSSSIDHKDLQAECPLKQDNVRTQVYLTLQKFELVKVVDPAQAKANTLKEEESLQSSSLKAGQQKPTGSASPDEATLEEQPGRRGKSEKKLKKQRQDEEQYQVKMTGFLQCDPKLSKLKFGLYRAALPTYTRDFYGNLVDYLKNTY